MNACSIQVEMQKGRHVSIAAHTPSIKKDISHGHISLATVGLFLRSKKLGKNIKIQHHS